MTHLKEGDKAPAFLAEIETGEKVSLEQYRGRKLILYFYPKDNTPGCTAESCNLRDNYSALKEQGFEILGVSPDPISRHNKFIDKFSFPFSLISDEDHKVLNAYGTWGPKKFMGREYDGVNRTTFVIDEEGIIIKIFTKVKTKDHTAQILAALAESN